EPEGAARARALVTASQGRAGRPQACKQAASVAVAQRWANGSVQPAGAGGEAEGDVRALRSASRAARVRNVRPGPFQEGERHLWSSGGRRTAAATGGNPSRRGAGDRPRWALRRRGVHVP